MNCLLY